MTEYMEYIILAFCAGLATGFSGLALALHLINREQEAYWEPDSGFEEDWEP